MSNESESKQCDVAKKTVVIERPPSEPSAFMAWARKYGSMIARTHFKNRGRGDNVEIHISAEQLAAFLAFGFEVGAKAERGGRGVRDIDYGLGGQPTILVREDCIEEES